MKMDLIYPIEDSIVKGKFIADKACPNDFDGHLEVEVSGETLGVADVYDVMKALKADNLEIRVVSPKVFKVSFIKKEEVESIFNGVTSLFEDVYANADYAE